MSQHTRPTHLALNIAHVVARVMGGASHNITLRIGSWFLSMMLTSWGLLLLIHPILFLGPGYIGLIRLAPEVVWGWSAMTIGLIRLVALIINGTFISFRWSPHVRFVMDVLSCFIWFQITLGFAAAGTGTGLAIYPFLFLFDAYNSMLAASEAGVVERRYADGRR
jgi:hypothetical protein